MGGGVGRCNVTNERVSSKRKKLLLKAKRETEIAGEP